MIDLYEKVDWIKLKKKEINDLINLCKSKDQFEVVKELVQSYLYICDIENRKNNSLRKIKEQITDHWGLTPADTRIVVKDIEDKNDSSAAMQQMIKPFFTGGGWRSAVNFPNKLASVIADKDANNIVLIDDFSGTGKSLNKILKWIEDKSIESDRKKLQVYACFVGCMSETIDSLDVSKICDLYFVFECKKGISDKYEGKERVEKIKFMRELEKAHGNIAKRYSLGFKSSEAVFNFSDLNSPNNVFPIFWSDYSGSDIRPPFPRTPK